MTARLVVEPEAQAEITKAASWYEARRESAAMGFLRAIEQVLQLLIDNPMLYQVAYRDVRRAPITDYPYALFYRPTETHIIVIACLHTSRDPDTWREWLR